MWLMVVGTWRGLAPEKSIMEKGNWESSSGNGRGWEEEEVCTHRAVTAESW